MHFALYLLALASLASAQPALSSFPGEPSCAVGCLVPAIIAASCSPSDLACQCSPSGRAAIQSAITPCIVQNCFLSDALNAGALAASVCASFSSSNPQATVASPSAPAAQPNPLPSAPSSPSPASVAVPATTRALTTASAGYNMATMATAPIAGGPAPTVGRGGFSPLSTAMSLSLSQMFAAPFTQSIISATLTLPTILLPSGGAGASGGRGGRGNGTRGGGGRGGRNGTRSGGGMGGGRKGGGNGDAAQTTSESVFQSFVCSTATQGPLQQTRAGGVSRGKSLGLAEGVVMGLGSILGLVMGVMGLL